MENNLTSQAVDETVKAFVDDVFAQGYAAGELAGYARGIEEARRALQELTETPVPQRDPLPLDFPVTGLKVSHRVKRILKEAGIGTIGDLVARSEQDLYELRQFGEKALREVKTALANVGHPRLSSTDFRR